MPTLNGWVTDAKREDRGAQHTTISPAGEDKWAHDIAIKGTVYAADSDQAEAGSTTLVINATGHTARPNDLIRFTSGAAINYEAYVHEVTANTITLWNEIPVAPAASDDFDILRSVTMTLGQDGSFSGPVKFVRDGIIEDVTEDTGTPANNIPLPVKLTSVTGDINITANDLNVQLSHSAATPDSVQVGDGTEIMLVNASGEAQVADDTARTTLASIDGKQTDIRTAVQSIDTDFDVLLSTRASEATLVLAEAHLGNIDTKTIVNSIDSNNSTTTPLSSGSSFVGTATDVSQYASISIQLYADQDSAVDGMKFQFSVDGVNWDESNDFNLDTAVSNTRRFQFPVTAQFFRVNYENGATGQTAFRVQTILHTSDILTSIHRVDGGLTLDRSVQVVKSVISGETTAGGGSFVNVKVSPSGALETNASQTTHDDLNANANIQVGDVDVSGANPVPISAASLPLPTGAATEATLTSILADTANIDTSTAAIDTTLDVNLSTRASEVTAAAILADTASLDTKIDVNLSTVATEATLSSIETDIDGLSRLSKKTLSAQNLETTTSPMIGDANLASWRAQEFIATKTGWLKNVKLKLFRGASLTGTFKIIVTTDNAGDPSSTTVDSLSIDVAPLPTSVPDAFQKYTLNEKLYVVEGQSYWMVFDPDFTSGGGNNLNVAHDNSATYAGAFKVSTDSGATWAADFTGVDLTFEIEAEISVEEAVDPGTVITTSYVDASSSNIPGNATNPLQLIASTTDEIKSMQFADTTGQFLEIMVGAVAAETRLVLVGPGSDQTVPVRVPEGTRLSVRRVDDAAAINVGSLAINFIG